MSPEKLNNVPTGQGWKNHHPGPPIRTWPSAEITKSQRLDRQRMQIPVCPSCGIHCSICAEHGQFGKCCLEQ